MYSQSAVVVNEAQIAELFHEIADCAVSACISADQASSAAIRMNDTAKRILLMNPLRVISPFLIHPALTQPPRKHPLGNGLSLCCSS